MVSPFLRDLLISLPVVYFCFVLLSSVGCPYLFSGCVLTASLVAFLNRKTITPQLIVKYTLFACINIFFREIQFRGQHKIPKTGAVIFAVAPHANQFLDPILVMKVVGRPVGFLAAAKSMRRRWIGLFARLLNSIPVERPQDIAKAGKGKVSINGKEVTGTGTTFTSDLQPGHTIVIAGEGLVVASVTSDTSLTVTSGLESSSSLNDAKYSFAPKVDQNLVFEEVFNTLNQGQCIGIFPEGGSHDRPDLLPLKAGVTIMGLGAAAKHSIDVVIIPIGLNYFGGHRFRSRAYIDIGDPIPLTTELVDAYKQGGAQKRQACSTLLQELETSLRSLIVTAPDHSSLHVLWAIRRLYAPTGVKLSTVAKLELTRRFEIASTKFADDARVKQLVEDVKAYNHQLEIFGLRDHQVHARIADDYRVPRLIFRAITFFILSLVTLPGLILNAPIMITAHIISQQKAAEAVASSKVKLKGNDVLATWKVLVGAALFPLTFIVYPLVAGFLGSYYNLGVVRTWCYFSLFQLPVMYGSVRFMEVGLDVGRTLHSLVLSLMLSKGIVELNGQRERLAQQIRALVSELGPKLYGEEFETMRVLKQKELATDANASDQDVKERKLSNEELNEI